MLLTSRTKAVLRATRDATRTIPIVMIAIDYDPMARGYIAGLPRPSGNTTGLFFQQLELTGRRLKFLEEAPVERESFL